MNIQDVLGKLSGVRKSGAGWIARCPAHDDKKASLAISSGLKVPVILHCFVGCEYEAIAKNIGYEVDAARQEWRERTYDYRNEGGELLYQVVRTEPRERGPKGEKKFSQRRPTPDGEWAWHLDCTKRQPGECKAQGHDPLPPLQRVPYRLKDLRSDTTNEIYLVEGEKKCDRLRSIGLLATTIVGGANGWREEYTEWFRNRNVVVLPDNDEPGQKYAKTVVSALEGKAQWVSILSLPGLEKAQDVDDWLTAGHSRAELEKLVKELFDREIEAEGLKVKRTRWSGRMLVQDDSIKKPLAYLRGDIFTQGDMSMIFGPSGSGKSYLAMFIGGQIAMGREVAGMKTRRSNVLFLSEEMIDSIVKERTRLMWSDSELDEMADRWQVQCQAGLDFCGDPRGAANALRGIIESRLFPKPDVVFIDALADIHSGDENSNQVMGIVAKAIRQVARITKTAIILIHHSGKASEFRTGKDLARGASIVTDKCEAVLWARGDGTQEVRSIVSFEKARHVVGHKPATFTFAQEEDETRMENVGDTDGEPTWKPGISIVTAPYEETNASDRDVRKVASIVAQLVAGNNDEPVPMATVNERLEREGFTTRKRPELVRRASALGLIVRIGKSKVGVPGN